MIKILKFYSECCGPCKQLSKNILKLVDSETFKDKHIEIVNLDADENDKLVEKYNVKSVPTLIKLKDEQEIARKIGAISLSALEDFILKEE